MNILSESGLRYNYGQLAAKNREKCAGETIHFIDSTPVEVCKNNKILRHKVARDCTSRGKSTKGWFFGFKLHGVCTADMIVESLTFTTGSVHDSKMAQKLTKGIIGKAFSNGESACFRHADKELENAGIIVKEPKAGDS